MLRCCACNKVADLAFVHNTKLGLCVYCAEYMQGIPMQSPWSESEGAKAFRAATKKHAQQYGRGVCECGETLYHGGWQCHSCRSETLAVLTTLCGADVCDNHPVIWHVVESDIRFKQWLGLAHEDRCAESYYWYHVQGDSEGMAYAKGILNMSRIEKEFRAGP